MKPRQKGDGLGGFDIIAGTVFLAVGLVGLLFAYSDSRWAEVFSGESAGTVAALIREDGAVRFRKSDGVSWQDLGGGSWHLDGGDAAFTGPDGIARLIFDAGGEVRLEPNTLVLVDRPPASSEWKMKWLWRVLADSPPEEPVRLNVKNGKVRVRLTRGDAPVELGSSGKSVVVQAPTTAEDVLVDAVAERGTERLRIVNAGSAGARIASSTGSIDLLPGASSDLEVPPDSSDESDVVMPETRQEQARRWKPLEFPLVAAKSEPKPKKAAGPWVFLASPNREAGDVDDVSELGRMGVRLSWKPRPGARSYEVKVFAEDSKSRERRPASRTRAVREPATEVMLDNPGVTAYYFEVTAVRPDGTRDSSGARPLRVSLHPPSLRLPAAGARLNLGQSVILTWAKTRLTQRYQVQIASDPSFKHMVQDDIATANYQMPKLARAGRYFWRVRASSNFAESEWSEPRSFHLK